MQVNMEGVAVGIVALVMIGVFHPIVIKCEYYFSHRVWPLFLAAGIGFYKRDAFYDFRAGWCFLSMEYPGTAGTGAAGGEGSVSQESKPERAYGLHQITKDERTLFFRNARQVCRVSIYYAGLQKLF